MRRAFGRNLSVAAQMTNWIEQKATRAKAQEEARPVSLEQARELVDQLEAVVRLDVDKWNAHFRKKIDGVSRSLPSGAFKVRKTSFPPVTVDVSLIGNSSSTIQIETTKRRSVGAGVYTLMRHFELAPTAAGAVGLTTPTGESLSLEAASRIVIETIITEDT